MQVSKKRWRVPCLCLPSVVVVVESDTANRLLKIGYEQTSGRVLRWSVIRQVCCLNIKQPFVTDRHIPRVCVCVCFHRLEIHSKIISSLNPVSCQKTLSFSITKEKKPCTVWVGRLSRFCSLVAGRRTPRDSIRTNIRRVLMAAISESRR